MVLSVALGFKHSLGGTYRPWVGGEYCILLEEETQNNVIKQIFKIITQGSIPNITQDLNIHIKRAYYISKIINTEWLLLRLKKINS